MSKVENKTRARCIAYRGDDFEGDKVYLERNRVDQVLVKKFGYILIALRKDG